MWVQLPAWTMVGVAMTLYIVSIKVNFDKYHAYRRIQLSYSKISIIRIRIIRICGLIRTLMNVLNVCMEYICACMWLVI